MNAGGAGVEWSEEAMAAAAAAAGLDLQDGDGYLDDEDDWGPDDLSELLDADFDDDEVEEGGEDGGGAAAKKR